MKSQIRLLAIDDSPFTFNQKYTLIIGAVMRGGKYMECVLKSQIMVDGMDSTIKIIEMINNTRYKKQLKAILLDGISFGGFNIVDIEEVYSKTKLPVITVTRDAPDFEKIQIALKKTFSDWEKRWKLLSKEKLTRLNTKHNPIFIQFCGLAKEEAKEIIKLSTIRGVIPEPIRVAHIIASGITKGESYGKA